MTVRTRPPFRSKLHWRTQFAIQNMPPPPKQQEPKFSRAPTCTTNQLLPLCQKGEGVYSIFQFEIPRSFHEYSTMYIILSLFQWAFSYFWITLCHSEKKIKSIRAVSSYRFCIILIFFCKKNPTSFFCLYFDFVFVVAKSTLNKVRKGLPTATKSPNYLYMNITEYC